MGTSIPKGNALLEEVADLTGLPKGEISEELVQLLNKVGTDPNQLTIEQLRTAMIAYLSEIIGQEPDTAE